MDSIWSGVSSDGGASTAVTASLPSVALETLGSKTKVDTTAPAKAERRGSARDRLSRVRCASGARLSVGDFPRRGYVRRGGESGHGKCNDPRTTHDDSEFMPISKSADACRP